MRVETELYITTLTSFGGRWRWMTMWKWIKRKVIIARYSNSDNFVIAMMTTITILLMQWWHRYNFVDAMQWWQWWKFCWCNDDNGDNFVGAMMRAGTISLCNDDNGDNFVDAKVTIMTLCWCIWQFIHRLMGREWKQFKQKHWAKKFSNTIYGSL